MSKTSFVSVFTTTQSPHAPTFAIKALFAEIIGAETVADED